MDRPVPRLRTVLWRGLHCKCPQCGEGKLFGSWNKLRDSCDKCGLKYLNDNGDLWGYLLIGDRALFILPLVVMIYFRVYNPNSPWFYIFAGLLIFTFIYTFPNRNGMGVGVDYLIRRSAGDLSEEAKPQDEIKK